MCAKQSLSRRYARLSSHFCGVVLVLKSAVLHVKTEHPLKRDTLFWCRRKGLAPLPLVAITADSFAFIRHRRRLARVQVRSISNHNSTVPFGTVLLWCRRPDLNRYALKEHRILSPGCLPIPPLRLKI